MDLNPHESPAAMFAYHWVFVRIAERLTRQRHSTRISEIFAALAKRTLAEVPPKFRAATKNRDEHGWYHGSVWIGRRAFATLFGDNDEVVNFMAAAKSPIGPLTAFFKTTQFESIASGHVQLAELLADDQRDVALLQSLFGCGPEDFSFDGVPLIGADFPMHTIWFGVSTHAWLWERSAEERAAACVLRVRLLPEVMPLSWSPLGDHVPLAIRDGEFSLEGQRVALATYARASGMVVQTRRRGRIRADYLHGSIDGTIGYAAIAPYADPRHRSTQQQLRQVLNALSDASDMVPEILLLATDLSVGAVAEEVHAFHAREQKPLQVFAASMSELRHRVRQFPWLRDPDATGAPLFSTEDGDLGMLIRFACFLHTWRFLAPTADASTLRQSWESLRVPGTFDDLSCVFKRHSLLPSVFTAADLTLPQLTHFATDSPADLLAQEVEEWIITHEELLGSAWGAVMHRIAATNMSMNSALEVRTQPQRSLRALRAVMARHPDDGAQEKTALTMLLVDDVDRALRMLDELLSRSSEREVIIREHVLDIAVSHIRHGDFERFKRITQWPNLRKHPNPKHFVTSAASEGDEALGEAVVRHLVTHGLAAHVVREVEIGSSAVVGLVARTVERMTTRNLSDAMMIAGLRALRDALRERQ